MIRKVPLIVILGSTGTGKTKLSIELAERFGGEIISADSMQVYSKLDIVTAKATKAEQARAKHHLLDVAKPGEAFTVVNFRDAALLITEDLMSKSKFPIVVGGTNYYIESLLWNMLVVDDSHKINETETKPSIKITENLLETKLTSADLHALLKKIDPTSANRIHPNNRRKIIRALEVFQKSGETLTSIFENQRSASGGNRLGGPLRYTNTILFWLRCNQDVLNERLEKRVDSMLELGLLPEIRNFYKENLMDSCENKYTKGILQSIGLKEFIPYLEQYNEEDDRKNEAYLKSNNYKLPEPNGDVDSVNDRPQGLDVLISCLDRLKLVTNRYSKKQIKWIKNRFLSSVDRQVPNLYKLDTSDVSQWNSEVYLPAVDVIESVINGGKPKLEPLEKLDHPGKGLNEETTNYCPTCERVFIGEFQWNLHLTSNKHKRRKESLRKKEKSSLSVPDVPETEKVDSTKENT